MIIIISYISFLIIIFSFFILLRINIVHKFRMGFLKKIHALNLQNIKNGNYEAGWRYKNLAKTSFDKMLWQLFRFHWTMDDEGNIR